MEPCPPYPITRYYGWTRANYATNIAQGGMWIPKKGVTLKLNMFNLPVYERCIRNYERNDLQVRDGKYSSTANRPTLIRSRWITIG